MAFGAAGIFVGLAAKAELKFEPAVLAVGDLPPGAKKVVILRVQNVSRRRIRLVGIEDSCSRWGCFRASGLPIGIQPSAWGMVPIDLQIAASGFVGEFAEDIVIYTDSEVDRRVVAHLAGRAVPEDAVRR